MMPIHAYREAFKAYSQFSEKENSMKISDSFKNTTSVSLERTSSGKASGGKTAPVDSNAEAKAVESVTLSPMSAQLQSLEASMAADNVFDAEKVAAIKSAIADGQFKVSAEKIADGLIESVKDLLNTKTS